MRKETSISYTLVREVLNVLDMVFVHIRTREVERECESELSLVRECVYYWLRICVCMYECERERGAELSERERERAGKSTHE